jgi:hypothetical protein
VAKAVPPASPSSNVNMPFNTTVTCSSSSAPTSV